MRGIGLARLGGRRCCATAPSNLVPTDEGPAAGLQKPTHVRLGTPCYIGTGSPAGAPPATNAPLLSTVATSRSSHPGRSGRPPRPAALVRPPARGTYAMAAGHNSAAHRHISMPTAIWRQQAGNSGNARWRVAPVVGHVSVGEEAVAGLAGRALRHLYPPARSRGIGRRDAIQREEVAVPVLCGWISWEVHQQQARGAGAVQTEF